MYHYLTGAALAALRGDRAPVRAMVETFRRRRDLIVAGLDRLPGFSCAMPRGAFYAFPNTSGTGWSSRELQDRLLHEAGVACLSGTSFGAFGEGFMRFSYANSIENIEEGLGRVRAWLEANPR